MIKRVCIFFKEHWILAPLLALSYLFCIWVWCSSFVASSNRDEFLLECVNSGRTGIVESKSKDVICIEPGSIKWKRSP